MHWPFIVALVSFHCNLFNNVAPVPSQLVNSTFRMSRCFSLFHLNLGFVCFTKKSKSKICNNLILSRYVPFYFRRHLQAAMFNFAMQKPVTKILNHTYRTRCRYHPLLLYAPCCLNN